MAKKLVNKDPFSNGTQYMIFETYNCGKCIKSSEPRDGGMRYTNADKNNMPRCSIQRDIVTRMFNNDPIKEETVRICTEFSRYGVLCPYMKTERRKRKNYTKIDKQQTALEL